MQGNRRARFVTPFAASLVFALTSASPSTALAQSKAGDPWPQSPAVAADPPLLLGPTQAAPLSTSGTDIAPSPNDRPSAPGVVKDASENDDHENVRAKMRELEARLALDEARLKTLETDVGPLRHLKVQGYIQAQYRYLAFNAAGSPNLVNGALPPGITSNDVIAKSDGTTTNSNLFRLRRTRLRTVYETDVARVLLEVDILPAGGPAAGQGTIGRNATVTGIAKWSNHVKTEFTAGLFKVPFRLELLESSMFRPFIERTWASQNVFPTERDLGVSARTILYEGRGMVDVGVLNGQRLGDKQFVILPDLNASKDFFAMAQGKVGPFTASLHGYAGRSQIVDPTLLRVKNFKRLGANIGLAFAHTLLPSLGETKASAELMFGTNMDTGVIYAFALPVVPRLFTDNVGDLNERGLYLRAEQELTKWGLAGFRYDTYTTDSSLKNNARDTYTGMAGIRFSKSLRVINEISYAIDNIHPAGAPAPSRDTYGYTAWMQGTFY